MKAWSKLYRQMFASDRQSSACCVTLRLKAISVFIPNSHPRFEDVRIDYYFLLKDNHINGCQIS